MYYIVLLFFFFFILPLVSNSPQERLCITLSYPYLADLFLNGVVELQFRRLRCLVDFGVVNLRHSASRTELHRAELLETNRYSLWFICVTLSFLLSLSLFIFIYFSFSLSLHCQS